MLCTIKGSKLGENGIVLRTELCELRSRIKVIYYGVVRVLKITMRKSDIKGLCSAPIDEIVLCTKMIKRKNYPSDNRALAI